MHAPTSSNYRSRKAVRKKRKVVWSNLCQDDCRRTGQPHLLFQWSQLPSGGANIRFDDTVGAGVYCLRLVAILGRPLIIFGYVDIPTFSVQFGAQLLALCPPLVLLSMVTCMSSLYRLDRKLDIIAYKMQFSAASHQVGVDYHGTCTT
mmetsp:Transcript_20262/g.58146  ORF Transcript_20262/g.58146 Transcript_20262/m.58146 type:complete len:148 (-) Transcript_20262:40-483(-)